MMQKARYCMNKLWQNDYQAWSEELCSTIDSAFLYFKVPNVHYLICKYDIIILIIVRVRIIIVWCGYLKVIAVLCR